MNESSANLLSVTPEDLLFGATSTFEVTIPGSVLRPGLEADSEAADSSILVELRPLTIGTFQLIMKATRQDAGLIPLLMIKESLVQPTLTLEQIKQLHLGLVNFLIDHIRHISGLGEKKTSTL